MLTSTRRTQDHGPGRATVLGASPRGIPAADPFGITVIFRRRKPEFEGYGAIAPIIEVLVDVGMIADERLEDWERELQDPDAGET